MRRLSAWLFVASVCGPTAFAQTPTTASPINTLTDPIACISDWVGWQATVAETAAIETVPVPSRLRRLLPIPCGDFVTLAITFADWHLNFGSEASLTAALNALERGQLPRAVAPEEVERARRAAEPDIRQAATLSHRPDAGLSSALSRFVDRSVPIRRLKSLVELQGDTLILARVELQAAEEYGSLPLLARAERHLMAAPRIGGVSLPSDELTESLGITLYYDHPALEDLILRAAVLRANVTRSAADVARAEALVTAAERPEYSEIAFTMFTEGHPLCERDENDAPAQAACREQRMLWERVLSWSINRAKLDLIKGRAEDHEAESAGDLAARSYRLTGGCCGIGSGEESIRLWVMDADHHRRRFDRDRAPHDFYNDNLVILLDLRNALNTSAFSPVKAPQRFRRVAELWLAQWRRGLTMPVEPGGSRYSDWPEQRRYASYLQHLLADLPAISAGAP